MARRLESVCRLCRREGMKLFLKGSRCGSDKCALSRRDYGPGEHGKMRRKPSNYALQLREKQKVKRFYGILERQFRLCFKKAEKIKGVTGEKLLELLERRLDNVTYRLCFAASRPQARQLVLHGHIYVNSRRVNIPSFIVKQGDKIEFKGKEKLLKQVKDNIEIVGGAPAWLTVDHQKFSGEVIRVPQREEISIPVQEELIVELYSK